MDWGCTKYAVTKIFDATIVLVENARGNERFQHNVWLIKLFKSVFFGYICVSSLPYNNSIKEKDALKAFEQICQGVVSKKQLNSSVEAYAYYSWTLTKYWSAILLLDKLCIIIWTLLLACLIQYKLVQTFQESHNVGNMKSLKSIMLYANEVRAIFSNRVFGVR